MPVLPRDLPLSVAVVGRSDPRRAGGARPRRRPRERERGQRRGRLRRLRLLRDPRVRLALERAGARGRPAGAGVHLLPALQRPPGRGAEGTGQLPPRRQPAGGGGAARPEAAAGEDLRGRDAGLRPVRDVRGGGRRERRDRATGSWRSAERRVAGNGRLPGAPERVDPGPQPHPHLAARLEDAALPRLRDREERVAPDTGIPFVGESGEELAPVPRTTLLPDALRRLDPGRPALPLRGRAAPRRLARPAQPALLHRARGTRTGRW